MIGTNGKTISYPFNNFRVISVFFVFLFCFACAPAQRYTTDNNNGRSPRRRYYRTGQVVETNLPPSGETFYQGKTFHWNTSFYGSKFHGRKTANGEVFDMYELTCAHRELPFNTLLEITNPKTNQRIVVRVNDRGPFIRGRDLDLSYGAAKQVGLIEKGVKVLKVRILEISD